MSKSALGYHSGDNLTANKGITSFKFRRICFIAVFQVENACRARITCESPVNHRHTSKEPRSGDNDNKLNVVTRELLGVQIHCI